MFFFWGLGLFGFRSLLGFVVATLGLFLSLIVASQTLANGRTTVLQGTIHLMLFAIYLFTTFVP